MARDGARESWPSAPLIFTLMHVSGLWFDADDRTGVAITRTDAGTALAIGRIGHLRAASATVWLDEPC